MWSFDTDAEIFGYVKRHLRTAVICDALDMVGYRNQAMHSRLRPLLSDPKNCGFVGRARTLCWMEAPYVVEEDPYGLEIEAMDSLKPGDVMVHSTDPGRNNAPWGELMTNVARLRGAHARTAGRGGQAEGDAAIDGVFLAAALAGDPRGAGADAGRGGV